jgi:hypothetical protein
MSLVLVVDKTLSNATQPVGKGRVASFRWALNPFPTQDLSNLPFGTGCHVHTEQVPLRIGGKRDPRLMPPNGLKHRRLRIYDIDAVECAARSASQSNFVHEATRRTPCRC